MAGAGQQRRQHVPKPAVVIDKEYAATTHSASDRVV